MQTTDNITQRITQRIQAYDDLREWCYPRVWIPREAGLSVPLDRV